MAKETFYKNLFQMVSWLGAVLVLVVALLGGYIASLGYEGGKGWILLVIAAGLLFLFFAVGSFWIFQQVSIGEKGIRITLFGKELKKCEWDEVAGVEDAHILRNPALRIRLKNGTEIHLDKRKCILSAIERYTKTSKETSEV